MDWQKVIDELRRRADGLKPIADSPYKHETERTIAAVTATTLGALAESLRAGLEEPVILGERGRVCIVCKGVDQHDPECPAAR